MKMLPHRTRLCVLMLIILMFCQGSAYFKPSISPSKPQIVINEGESLVIRCESIEPIKFADPKVLGQSTKTSTANIQSFKRNIMYVRILEKLETVFGDTGWYGCTSHDVDIANFNDPKVNWLYAYVKSDTNLFVEENNNIHLNMSADNSIVIPCRTTSPNLKPILINGNEDILNEASFDPKIGFTITNLSMKDNDSYKCLIKEDNKEYIVNYVLSVNTKHFSEPIMQGELLTTPEGHHVFYMNCSVEIDMSIRYVFSWNTPQSGTGEIKIHEFRKHLGRNIILTTSVLTIFDVTKENSGAYECFISSIYGIKDMTKTVIFGHEMGFLQFKHYFHVLANQFLVVSNYYRKESGSNVEWSVIVLETSRNHYYQWFKPNGEIIVNSQHLIGYPPKYSMKNQTEYLEKFFLVTLKINSLNVIDSGNYTLEKKNRQGESKKVNITLDVTDKPIPVLMSINSYYSPYETTEFHCQVTSNPRPNITWRFLKYPNYTSFENLTSVPLTDVTEIADYSTCYKFESIVKMPIEVPGKLTCEACNEIGCNSVTENIIVSDGLGVFGIIGPKEFVLKGDNIKLICAASVYNYTDDITWTVLVNRTEEPVAETDRLKIVRHKTPFTYRSTLNLSNVQESDAKDYFCTGNIINTSNDEALHPLSYRANYKLVIYDPVPPFLAKTNMNKTKTRTIDFIAEGHSTMKLQCYAEGTPKPTVTWYKDNMLLTNNNLSDQYLLLHKGQELHIKYWMQYDSGNYSCRATSRIGINETYQLITMENTKGASLYIVLVTLISILGFILILATFFTVKIRRERKVKKILIKAHLMHFEKGAIQCLNPNLTVKDQAEILPYDKKWEFPVQQLMMKEELGRGEFGVVMKAEATGIRGNKNVTIVAVKIIRPTTETFSIRALTSELKIMVHLGKHLNIVNLLGACTKNILNGELMMIIEYCRFGNLHNYLLRHRNDFINQINPETGKYDFTIGKDIPKRTVNIRNDNSNLNSNIDAVEQDCPESNPDSPRINLLSDSVLSNNTSKLKQKSNYCKYCSNYKHQNLERIRSQDLLSWAFQVARGMEYLSQRKILHGDLAARNILLAEDNIVKISDFGLSKNMYKNGNYKKKGNILMPLKWMAIESIRDRIFSTQSDVWSFGIMLWEFFTLAETPYAGMQEKKQYEKLVEGYRLEQPDYAVRKIYDIMLQCWAAKPTLRPSFRDLVEDIGRLMQESVRKYYITLSHQYMEMMEEDLKNKKDYLMMMSAPDHTILSLPIYKCMHSLSKDTSNSHLHMHLDRSTDESKILRPFQDHSQIEFLSSFRGRDRSASNAKARRSI